MTLGGRVVPCFGSTATGRPLWSKALVGRPSAVMGRTFEVVNAWVLTCTRTSYVIGGGSGPPGSGGGAWVRGGGRGPPSSGGMSVTHRWCAWKLFAVPGSGRSVCFAGDGGGSRGRGRNAVGLKISCVNGDMISGLVGKTSV